MISSIREIAGLRVTVMGLGLNGGGTASARFFAEHGALVTVTDLRTGDILAPSMEKLSDLSIRYVLGKHDEEDFSSADIVIKNPSVRRDNPLLSRARKIETDISVFLSLSGNPVIAVTGSKGKSTTVSAIHHALRKSCPGARLGGNITVSPLSFLDSLSPDDPVVLELSSWQLADLRGSGLLKPKVSIITNILPDHQNMYSGMDEYVADKRLIYADQDKSDYTILNFDDPYTSSFSSETEGTVRFFSGNVLPEGIDGAFLNDGAGYFRSGTVSECILGETPAVPGEHHRMNLLSAALALYSFGIPGKRIKEDLKDFPGIEHRMEFVARKRGISFYNDSAATIPHATAAALKSLSNPVHLICGGTDKNLDFSILNEVAEIPETILLLAGTATEKISTLLENRNIPFKGPYGSLGDAVVEGYRSARPGDIVLLSPGCASFGMFLNEFDRGATFKSLVAGLES